MCRRQHAACLPLLRLLAGQAVPCGAEAWVRGCGEGEVVLHGRRGCWCLVERGVHRREQAPGGVRTVAGRPYLKQRSKEGLVTVTFNFGGVKRDDLQQSHI